MKRAGNLYNDIYELKNLYLAYYKASKGKKSKPDIISFSHNLSSNIVAIQEQFLTKDVRFGDYHYFMIKDPKSRLICAASFPERVIHHAVMNVTEPYFESFQIFDSYACREGKGMHKAVSRAFSFCKNYTYYLKFDIRKFFNSVDHNILYNLLLRRFKDKELLNLFSQLIGSYNTTPGKGIPIGNLTSQHFANYYLAYLDRFIKEDLKIKSYLRYMDDFIIFINDKNQMYNLLLKIETFLNNKLLLELKPVIINKVTAGFTFLGCRIFKNKVFLSKRSKRRFKEKFIKYESNYLNGNWDMDELLRHINPLISFTKTVNSRNLRNTLIDTFGVISE